MNNHNKWVLYIYPNKELFSSNISYHFIDTNHSSSLKSAYTSSSYTQEKFNHKTLVSVNGDYGKDLTKNELIQKLKVRLQNSKCPINHQALSLENSEVQTPDMLKKYRPSKSNFGSFKSTNGNLVFSDKQKCPPPLFTNDQKNLAIEAWEKINHYIEKVQNNLKINGNRNLYILRISI